MTPSIVKIYRAGRVRRWHTNADLNNTDDRVDGHSGRVARLILALHPSGRESADVSELILAALIHDDGEHITGDIPADAKRIFFDLAVQARIAEDFAIYDLWGVLPCDDLDPHGRRWLHFADRLDAFMWVAHHRPAALHGDGWPEARAWLWTEGSALGAPMHVIDEALSMGDGR